MKHILLTTIAAVVLVGCGNPEADRALLKAAQVGNIEAVKQHLADGADVNAKDFAGATALHNAVRVKVGETTAANKDVAAQKEIIELLIAAGADVNAKDFAGATALHNAVRVKVGETTAANKDVAAQKEIIELLIAAGADVNAKNEDGMTPLHCAAIGTSLNYLSRGGRYGVDHKEIAELLISAGADVNAQDEDGETPVDIAIMSNQPQTANLLRKHGGKTAEELKAEGK